jgi:hypothetical protein
MGSTDQSYPSICYWTSGTFLYAATLFALTYRIPAHLSRLHIRLCIHTSNSFLYAATLYLLTGFLLIWYVSAFDPEVALSVQYFWMWLLFFTYCIPAYPNSIHVRTCDCASFMRLLFLHLPHSRSSDPSPHSSLWLHSWYFWMWLLFLTYCIPVHPNCLYTFVPVIALHFCGYSFCTYRIPAHPIRLRIRLCDCTSCTSECTFRGSDTETPTAAKKNIEMKNCNFK